MMRAWLIAFGLTVGIEGVIAALVAPPTRRLRCVVDSVMANVLTHPLASLLFFHQAASFAVIESGVFVVEALVYRFVTGLSWARAGTVALACNAISAATGYLFSLS